MTQAKFGIFALILLLWTSTAKSASIEGTVHLDDSWEPVIYLSLINSFEDLNTASYDFLIAEASIDSSGYFEMKELKIPAGNRIYRLHVCKKGDPVSTIIIGGKEENFIHFIMNANSEIVLSPEGENQGFHQSTITGNPANSSLYYLMKLQKDLQTPPALPSKQNREIIKKQIIGDFKEIADTSSFAIIKLMALHLIVESSDNPNLDFLNKTFSSIKSADSSNPYLVSFQNQLDFLEFQSSKTSLPDTAWIKYFGMAILIFAGITLFWLRIKRKAKPETNTKSELIDSLSIQEKKVFELLKTGASNKEISQELNIEVSTVKSHVHKIFSRLGINSRKEIVNKTW
jgi:DNA-binding CsgD family transcriptional regulator